jgi:hypothetical protein
MGAAPIASEGNARVETRAAMKSFIFIFNCD